MRINFSPGNVIQEYVLGDAPTYYEISMPVDSEIFGCGMRKGNVVIFAGSRDKRLPSKNKAFVVVPSGCPLPSEKLRYYFYVGMVVKKSWHVWELI